MHTLESVITGNVPHGPLCPTFILKSRETPPDQPGGLLVAPHTNPTPPTKRTPRVHRRDQNRLLPRGSWTGGELGPSRLVFPHALITGSPDDSA